VINLYFREVGGGAKVEFYWTHPTLGLQLVPAAAMFFQEAVGSPLTPTSTCPTGYTGSDPTSPTQ
jgi:hypothetical protein